MSNAVSSCYLAQQIFVLREVALHGFAKAGRLQAAMRLPIGKRLDVTRWRPVKVFHRPVALFNAVLQQLPCFNQVYGLLHDLQIEISKFSPMHFANIEHRFKITF